MKTFICTIMLLAICVAAYAQPAAWRPVYTENGGFLYKSADKNSEKMGVFATQASIILLDSTSYFYKVEVNNGDRGYILKQPISTRMMGRTYFDEPSGYFYRGEQNTQCPHMYVQASGLKTRKAPNTSSKVVQILPINKMECIDYIPLYKDGWVYIGDHFRERPEFIQYKFLGKEIDFDTLLHDYLNAKNKSAQERQIKVEQLLELSWNSKPHNTLEALRLFKKFHTENGTLSKYPKLDFEIYLAENMQQSANFEEREAFFVKADMHFLINNRRQKITGITEAFAKSIGTNKVTDYDDRFDCAWSPEFRYVGENIEIVFEKNEENETYGTLKKINFSPDRVLVINNMKIDNQTPERDFIKAFGKFIDIRWTTSPHTYFIQDGDAGFMEIKFKNGKAYSYELFYYC